MPSSNGSRTVFASVGARAWVAQARDERARIGGRVASPLTLTTAERRVVELAAAGAVEPRIAAQLIVRSGQSKANCPLPCGKLGVTSRARLARALDTAGAAR